MLTSCGDDDEVVIDTGSGDINVADGLYLTIEGQNPSSSTLLSDETVEDESFMSQARSGFVGGYMFLETGNYNVVQVTSKEITTTIGGTAETVTDEGSSCDLNDYMVVTTAEGGAAFNIPAAGFYRVTHDQMTSEMIVYKIEHAGLIGNATPGGWTTDTKLEGTVNKDGGSWSATGIVLRGGQFKVRFNCRWNLDRRVDPNAGFDAANGYQLFTNFGGSVADLATGNDQANIEQTEDGTYTATFTWSPQSGVALNLERTGDAPVITFNPNDYQFAVVGNASVDNWAATADRNLFHKEDNGVHTWYGVVTFAADGEWKFRANDGWDVDLGGDLAALSPGGSNIATPGAGAHYIVLTTPDEGDSWSATVTPGGWGLIGDGSPSMGWDTDTVLEPDAFNATDGITTYVHTGDFTDGAWKFRAGGDWALNLGGDAGFLTVDGDNLMMTAPGTYTVTLSFNGSEYSADIQ